MALLAEQDITDVAGVAVTLTAAAGGGDTAPTGNKKWLVVANGDASSKTVTIAVPGNAWNGQANPDSSFVVPAGERWYIPLDARYKNGSNVAAITYSAVTNVTVGVVAG